VEKHTTAHAQDSDSLHERRLDLQKLWQNTARRAGGSRS